MHSKFRIFRIAFSLARRCPASFTARTLLNLSPRCSPSAVTIQSKFYAKHSCGSGPKNRKQSMNRDVDYCDGLLDMQAFKNDLQHELNRYKQEILDQLSLRVNLNAYENLMIKLPNEQGSVPLNHIAKVTLKNPQMLTINVTMSPDKVALITDALLKSALNVNPQADGAMIHVPLPRVTRQHRESLVKSAKNLYNQCFERLRRVRKRHHDGFAKKEDSVSKDELVKTTKVLDETIKEYARTAEDMMKQKQKELMNENL